MTIILGALGLGLALFFFAVYPVQALFSALSNKNVGAVQKGGWAAAVLFFGPLAAAAYYFIHPKDRFSRWMASLSILFVGAAVWGLIAVQNYFTGMIVRDIDSTIPMISSQVDRSVPRQDVEELQKNLTTLRNELSTEPWYAIGDKTFLLALYNPLVVEMASGPLQPDDVRVWNQIFEERARIGWVDLVLRTRLK